MLIIFVVVCLIAAGGAAYILLRREPSAGAGAGSSSATSILTSSATTKKSGPGAATSTRSSSASASSSASSGDDFPSASTSSSTAAPSSTSDGDPTEVDQSTLKAQGISTFLGNNTGGIASWYHTDSGTDSTNDDYTVPGLAPSLATMLSSFSQDAAAAKTAFCGLAAEVYSPKTGKTVTLYIADAFDDTWVRTPASIDVIYGSFELLFGETTDNKDDVVKECWWQLTGEREDKYTYKGVGVG
ncbi:hypothetical protein JCM10450v2_004577 [Rhodotorula kratochvilovae]